MSRRKKNIKEQPIDVTKNALFSGGGNNKRIFKKVGHKGDYAIVKNNSANFKLNKTGTGTSGDPYIYEIDLVDNLTNVISDYKTRNTALEGTLRTIKSVLYKEVHSAKKQIVYKNIANIQPSFAFKDISTLIPSLVLSSNNDIKYEVYKESSALYNNNCYYIYFDKELNEVPYVEYSINNSFIDIDIIEKNKKHIKFKFKEVNTDSYITNYALSKHEDTKIDFTIEWEGLVKKDNQTIQTNNTIVNNAVSNGY